MAKAHPPEVLAWRVFGYTFAGLLTWVVAAFLFVILRNP